MKKHFILLSTFAALLLSATLLTGCGEDVQELADNGNNNSETVTETTVGENCTLFSTGDDGTRTALGADRLFYWSGGDQIYVNTDGANYKKTSSSTLSSNKRTADFVLEGVSLTAERCSVMYIGNGTTAATATKNDLKVKIEATQTQAAWGDSAHIGRAGDCGVAEATKDETTGKYSFNLRHKAAYLVFQPYKAAQITPNWKLIKIEIIADGTTLAGTYDFGTGELVGAGSSNTVEVNCNSTTANGVATGGFDLNHTAASTAKSCFAVIQPGNHKLTIRYTVQPGGSVNDVAGATFTINKEIPAVNADGSRTYNPNSVTIIKHELGVMLLNASPYYQWDAVNPYGSPSGAEFNSITYPTNASEIATHCATNSCKDMPNANELYWYIVNGDPHWDTTTPWSIDGGLTEYTNGLWLKTRNTILSEGKTFRADIGKDNVDMRLTYKYHSVSNSQAVLPVAERSKYFFLPALGYYGGGARRYWRTTGSYWSSSLCPGYASHAYYLNFFNSSADVGSIGSRSSGFTAGSQWFR